jgi:phage tail-like protein
MPRRETDPYASYNFLLEIDGITKAGFSEVTGLNAETTVIDYREGNEKSLAPRRLPGLSKFGNITLKRGVTKDLDLFKWRKLVMDGDIKRDESMSIVLRDEKGQEAVRWNLLNAWPAKYTGPDLKANASEMAIEAIEIVHEGVERQ